ncbi:flavin reductase family protein [Pseudonocardia sp.]|jgi:flavin reductase (DIM6/NTAB) family NADH-FMN oxidoreductase RutF|uniref:flavin reductase family protein n=1 Tax=Pseudonocardia sp. TaxID=60912 RepID=UPI003D09BC08
MSELETVGADTDAALLRRAFGCCPSGVAAVCALVGGEPVGMAVSTFTPVSLAPPLVSICADRASTTWPKLRSAPTVGVSVLAGTHEVAGRQLAARTGDRFAGLEIHHGSGGAVHLTGAAAQLECSLHDEVVAGDHTIVVLRVTALAAHHATEPLVFHGSRFHRLTTSQGEASAR